MIVPADLSDIAGVISSITSVLNKAKPETPLLPRSAAESRKSIV
jgi:hypothetical protein